LPEPDRQNDDYFADLANVLALIERLPESLRQALLTLEESASPENNGRLWASIKKRIPCVRPPSPISSPRRKTKADDLKS